MKMPMLLFSIFTVSCGYIEHKEVEEDSKYTNEYEEITTRTTTINGRTVTETTTRSGREQGSSSSSFGGAITGTWSNPSALKTTGIDDYGIPFSIEGKIIFTENTMTLEVSCDTDVGLMKVSSSASIRIDKTSNEIKHLSEFSTVEKTVQLGNGETRSCWIEQGDKFISGTAIKYILTGNTLTLISDDLEVDDLTLFKE